MEQWVWFLGTALLLIVNAIAAIAIETALRRTKTSLMRLTSNGHVTIDYHPAGRLFLTGTSDRISELVTQLTPVMTNLDRSPSASAHTSESVSGNS